MELQRKLVRLDPNNAGYKAALLNLENMMLTLQLNAANDAGRYAEALALKAQIAARGESEEAKSAGKPGKNTAGGFAELAGHAMLAGGPDKGLAARVASLALQPRELTAELNGDHALLSLARGAD